MRKQLKKNAKKLTIAYFLLFFLLVILKFDGSFDYLVNIRASIIQNRADGILNLNLSPFETIRLYSGVIFKPYAIYNIFGNIFPLIPLGFLIPLCFSKPTLLFLKSVIIFAIMIVCIELMQFVFLIGFFDVDDIILNLLGLIIGYIFYKIIYIKY